MARVLVVDDDELVRSTVRATLRRAGHDVVEAQDGQEASSVLARLAVDVVVSDIIMPEVDGIGLLLKLRKQYPHLRVIVISGGGRTQNVDFLRMAKTLGADLALAKPFTPEELQRAVQTVLAGSPGGSRPDS
jgi:CheY-like chemotaxis protein